MTKQTIYSYAEVCWMAFQNQCELIKLPEQDLVFLKKDGNILGEYKEIRENQLVYLFDEEVNVISTQCKCKLCMTECVCCNVSNKVCYNCWCELK